MSEDSVAIVLIVEDEPDVAETYDLWLSADYDVRIANDGTEGLEKLDADIDVVLLDRMMPGLTGGEVLDRIRDAGYRCRVAMVTAVEPDFDILNMGFDAYLSKPIRSEQLHDTVENLTERATYDRLLQEYYSLVETQATIEGAKSDAELAESEEYADLSARIDSLQEELGRTLGGVESDDDFIATIRELSEGPDT